MAAVINTNISSLNAQRNLTMSQSSLATSLQRLSSGLRINSAKDDAAGLAISQRMTSQINGLNRAAQNANDGVSLAQTAEGALGQVGDSLQRIRELAVQSANATNSSSDRAALQQEVSQLVSEITRIGNTTSFNGLKILDGSYTNQQYQIGANAGETISVSIDDARSSQLGASTLSSGAGVSSSDGAGGTGALGAAVAADAADGLVINGTAVDITGATTLGGIVDAINGKSATTGITAARSTTNELKTAFTASGATDPAAVLSINGVNISIAPAATAAEAAEAINKMSSKTGVTASADGADITFSSTGGADFKLAGDAGAATAFADVGFTDNTATGDEDNAVTFEAGITLSGKVGTSFTVDGDAAIALNLTVADGVATDPAAANALDGSGTAGGAAKTFTVDTMDISSIDGANDALAAVDAALTQVSGTRATLGAIQNRFTAVIANLSTTSENLSASRSRIQDADFAAETANMTRGQILQQAGTAMLAQANSLPNGVLALLR